MCTTALEVCYDHFSDKGNQNTGGVKKEKDKYHMISLICKI